MEKVVSMGLDFSMPYRVHVPVAESYEIVLRGERVVVVTRV